MVIALDTRSKRNAVMHFLVAGAPPLPNPSGTIDKGARFGFLGMVFDSAIGPVVTSYMTGIVDLMSYTRSVALTISDRIVDLLKRTKDVNL